MAPPAALSPDATSTEGSSSPSTVSNARKAYAATVPKKKRVRRQQVELKDLRELAEKLEHRLEQLKKHRLSSAQTPNRPINGNFSSSNSHSVIFGPASVWESIADRQFKERARAENKNEQLKAILRTQTSTAQTLQAKAQRALGDKELIGLTMMQLQDEGPRYWDLGSNDEGIFADLLELVVRTRLKLQQCQVEDPRTVMRFASWGISVGEPHTAAAACWRMFSLTPMAHKVAFNDTEKSDVVARSFTCSSMHGGQKFDIRGKHTCRKYVDEDGCVTIVYAGRSEPAEVNLHCQEVQLQKTVWIKVRPQLRNEDPGQQSAVVEMHSKTLPRFRNGNTGQEQRAREVIDWATRSHHMVNDWYHQKLSEILVEEDWKAFC
ncbi:hypothetical protein PI124_g9326 [Phytophthora idaei]|nr:hypothetical protein PI125_g8999 [Phytophthora idaei]KAG3157963.1 hypothetical protein PI126_g8058 [Phytophthora idaei]KAG3245929.1 hypothetical protein PI124_g9326 [Phytophthora idaei]